MDLESKIPDSDLPQVLFNRRRFCATVILSVFAFQSFYGSDPLLPKDETTFWQRKILEIVPAYGPVLISISFGFLIGFKPVLVFGFFAMASRPIIVELSIHWESKSLRIVAFMLLSMHFYVLFGITYLTVFHFKHYGKMRLIGAAVFLVVFASILDMAAFFILPPTWVPAIYGIYCFAMGIEVYFNIPNTPHILENVNLLVFSPFLIGIAGHSIVVFTWLQFRTAFESLAASVVFLAICFSAGVLTMGMLLLGWPAQWKQNRAEWKLKEEATNEWYRVN